METSIIGSDFYKELSQLEDLIMDFIEENGPHSLSDPGIIEIIKEKMIPKWADDIEVTNDTNMLMLYVRLILEDDYNSDINICFNFNARIRDLYTPLLKANIQDIRDVLKEHLDPIIPSMSKEDEYTKQKIHEVIEEVLKWIKYDHYNIELKINQDTGGYLVVNIYSTSIFTSTCISFHFNL